MRGDLCEVGVYHGKSFLPLACLREPDETAVAIDCFSEQQFNRDDSGVGSREALQSNLTKLIKQCNDMSCEDHSWLRVISVDSTTLTPQQLVDGGYGSIRVFSIDGSHTAEATALDLQLAQDTISTGGVVILDDVFNPDWPGVISGLTQHTNAPTSTLRPFLVGFNKVFICRQEYHASYLELFKPGSRKVAKLLESEVAIYAAGWIATFHGND